MVFLADYSLNSDTATRTQEKKYKMHNQNTGDKDLLDF